MRKGISCNLFTICFIVTVVNNSIVHGWESEEQYEKNKWALFPRRSEYDIVAHRRVQRRKKAARFMANAALLLNTSLLLKGGFAFPSFISSMLVSKIVWETNDDDMNDGATFKVIVSLLFSGISSLNGWLLKIVEEGRKVPAVKAGNEGIDILKVALTLGTRGMELVGGFALLFIHLIKL